jgi:lysine 2,3-aminomutase
LSQNNIRPIRPPDRTLRTGDDLAASGHSNDPDMVDQVAKTYAVAVTPHIAGLIDGRGVDDPIGLQFIPDRRELEPRVDEISDPIGDDVHSPVPGIVHRYPDRVLLLPTLICPVYCRFCFRREKVGHVDGGVLTPDQLDRAFDYIAARPAIREVILSGGDPLGISDRRLGHILDRIDDIEHVETIRIHSRVPVADPARITPALVAILSRSKPVWLSVHCNHAREISPETEAALAALSRAGIPLLSQTVLLRGVNDSLDVMADLLRALIRCRVKPYYLHHADMAPGTAHFRTSIAEGKALMRNLRGRLPGYALPSYVLDIPGGFGKAPLGPDELDFETGQVTDWRGRVHQYDDDDGRSN